MANQMMPNQMMPNQMMVEDPYAYNGNAYQMNQSHVGSASMIAPSQVQSQAQSQYPIDPRMQTMAQIVTSEEALAAQQLRQSREKSPEFNDSRKSYGSSDREYSTKPRRKSSRHRRSPSYSE